MNTTLPEPDRAPGRSRRRLPFALAGVGVAAALVLGGLYVWSDHTRDEGVSLPRDCADLLPADLAERLPGADEIELRGEMLDTVEQEDVLRVAHCEAVDDVDADTAHFSLQVVLYDPAENESVRRMRESVAQGRLAREEDDFESEYGDPPMRAVEWRSLSVGDGGYATASGPVDEERTDRLWSSLEYSFDNARVSLFHRTDGRVEPEEDLDALEDLAIEVTERLGG